jgi:hypothetical protein
MCFFAAQASSYVNITWAPCKDKLELGLWKSSLNFGEDFY